MKMIEDAIEALFSLNSYLSFNAKRMEDAALLLRVDEVRTVKGKAVMPLEFTPKLHLIIDFYEDTMNYLYSGILVKETWLGSKTSTFQGPLVLKDRRALVTSNGSEFTKFDTEEIFNMIENRIACLGWSHG